MKAREALLIFISLFTGCASAPVWEGHSKAELIEHFGIPDKQMETKEGELFQYSRCKSFMVPLGDGFYTGNSKCGGKVFLIKNDIVVKETKAHSK